MFFRRPVELPPAREKVSPLSTSEVEIFTLTLNTVFQGMALLLGGLAALFVARDIIIPVMLALVLKMVLQPLLRGLEKWYVPRTLAALLLLTLLVSVVVGLGTVLATPAAEWARRIPEGIPRLQERMGFVSKPLAQVQKFMSHADTLAQQSGGKVMSVAVQGTRLSDRIFMGTQELAGEVFTTLLILFYLLLAGDTFLRRLVEVLPRFKDKRKAVDISQQVERDISSYLLTITAMNASVGVSTGLVAQWTGLGDPLLWGTLVFILNYIPILGPAMSFAVLVLAGEMAVLDGIALMPAILYLVIHALEAMLITPMMLAKRFTLNPVLVILSLLFWYWMWGVAGAILAMPMLTIAKIICDRVEPLKPVGHVLEG